MERVLAALIVFTCVGEPALAEPPAKYNRLVHEKSPYLLQHKDNPVWWWAWGDEAFEAAKREDKPVFLSVGYSTCHWCHVMEHESFENDEVAKLLNENFICIKVDREERPDVDSVYMNAVHAMNGRGGWPMSVVLTPDRHPFFGGTYFPKARFMKLMGKIADAWKNDRQRVEQTANQLLSHLKVDSSEVFSSQLPDDDVFRKCFPCGAKEV